jgi:hypothetical protein
MSSNAMELAINNAGDLWYQTISFNVTYYIVVTNLPNIEDDIPCFTNRHYSQPTQRWYQRYNVRTWSMSSKPTPWNTHGCPLTRWDGERISAGWILLFARRCL